MSINTRLVAPNSVAADLVKNASETTNAPAPKALKRETPVGHSPDSDFVVSRDVQSRAAMGRELAKLGEAVLGHAGFAELVKNAPDLFKALGGVPSQNGASKGPVQAPGAKPVLTQHGGAVLDKPVVSNIYLGAYWGTTAGQADKAKNDAFTQEVGTSGFQNIAKQYGAGGPTFGGSTTVNVPNPKKVTEADVQKLVLAQLKAGTVKPNAQGLYNVVLPPNTVLDAGDGVTSKNGLGGFHGSVAGTDGKPVYYSVEAYSKGSNGIDFSGNAVDNITITESHEWMEAVTDPDVNSPIAGRNLGWYDDKDNGEIGDLAMSQLPLNQVWQRDAKGFAQQLEWSNKDAVYEINSKSGN